MTIENNYIYDNDIYGLDPHTGTHDMVIRNNFVYNNGGFGIICSVDCYNITIEKNGVHDNYHGIMLSRNMTNSFVKNNFVYNENVSGIFVSDSYNNQIVKNTIINSKEGITINDDDDDGAENLIKNNKIILDNQDKSDKSSQGKSKLQGDMVSQNKRNN